MLRVLFILLFIVSFSFGKLIEESIKIDRDKLYFIGRNNGVNSIAISPNGKYIASGSYDKTIKLWDIESKREIYIFKGHHDRINSVAFSPNGKYIASGSYDKAIKLWDIESKKEICTFKGHHNLIRSIDFSSNSKYIISGSDDSTIKLWDIESKKEVYTFKGHHDRINSIVFSSNGKYIASGSYDKTIKLWDVESKKEIYTFKGHDDGINSVTFSSNDKYIVSGSDDKTIKLWDMESKKEIYTFKGHINYVMSVVFSPNSKYIASGSYDKTIKLWDIESKKEIYTFKGHNRGVNSIVFSPNGKYIASGSYDSTIKLWDIESKKDILNFLAIGEKWICMTEKYINRVDDGTLFQKMNKYDKLEPIYPKQLYNGNLKVVNNPQTVIIYEEKKGKGEITIKNNSLGRIWWIDLLEENTSNCNLFAPERIQLLEKNETKTLHFELSAIRENKFPKEENKTITLKLKAVKTKPIIIKVPINIKSPRIELQKVYLTDVKEGKILNIEFLNIGGEDLNSSEIVTTLIAKEANITLDLIKQSLIKSGEGIRVTYPIDENLNLKNAKVKVLVRKNIYPIHTWEFEKEIKIVTSLLYYYIPLGIIVLIIFYYIRVLTHPLTKKLSQNSKELNNLDFKEIIQAKKLLSRLYRLNTILSENDIDREVLEKSINFYKIKSYSEKIKILTNRLLSENEVLRENLFKINLTKEFILNITSINIMFIDKLNDDTQKELNSLTSSTLVITTNEIREMLLKEKKYLLIIPTSKEIARVLIFHDSLLAFSHLLSNYMKLSQISPYQISQGVRNSFMFFGRDKALTHILTRELTNYFLIGARQIGKSSFLREIERNYKDISGIDCYYFTLHDENLLELLGINLWAKNDLKLEEFIQKIRIYGKPILFLLDEVDKFIINETQSNFKILNAFRALSEEGKCFFVMAGYWELYKSIYLNYFSPIKNFGEVLHIEELEYKACFELATKPMKALNLNYENEEIVKEMIDMCGQRANLIAINCNLIIQNLDLKTKVITREMIKSAQKSQDFVSNLKFSENDKLAKAILYFTIELDSFNLGELVEILENEGIKFEIEALKEALNKLEIAFYLKKIENRYYYRVPLFIEYIRGDDLKILKREIKRV